jgi:hypothetical protein
MIDRYGSAIGDVDFGISKVKNFVKRAIRFVLKITKHTKLAVSRKAKFCETAG